MEHNELKGTWRFKPMPLRIQRVVPDIGLKMREAIRKTAKKSVEDYDVRFPDPSRLPLDEDPEADRRAEEASKPPFYRASIDSNSEYMHILRFISRLLPPEYGAKDVWEYADLFLYELTVFAHEQMLKFDDIHEELGQLDKLEKGNYVTIRYLAWETEKNQEMIRRRIYRARDRGELKDWLKVGRVLYVDWDEGMRIASATGKRGRPRKNVP